jgi:GntR family transcriptional regulator, transcriptional repressor for pyruvate dehydrogenase complex
MSNNLLYNSILNEIESKIKGGVLVENDKLPSERLLAETYGVSRTVVREALKILQEKGLVKMITGRGNFITIPQEKDLIDKFETAIDNSSISQKDIIEAREIIEIAISQRVISRVVEEDIVKLKKIYEEMNKHFGNSEYYAQMDAEFHLQLAGCTKNNALKLITSTLNNVTDRSNILNDLKMRKSSHKEHLAIIKAIECRDNRKLEEAIIQHIQCFQKHIL